MHVTGEKQAKGSYKCVQCGEIIFLSNENDTLPSCPECHGTEWRKEAGLKKNKGNFTA
jgi:ribosomal protein S27AE